MVMKEAVEDKKMELMQLDTKIPVKDIDVLYLINTLDLYGLISDGINKYNTTTQCKDLSLTWLITQMFLLWSKVVNWNPTTSLVPALWKKRKDSFIDRLTRMMSGTITTIHLQKRMNQGVHTRLWVTTAF